MPETYDVLKAERVEVTDVAGEVHDGQDSTIRAKPSGVVFHVVITVNQKTFDDPAKLARAVDAVAAPYAGYFNEDVQVEGVQAITTFQDFDDNDNQVSRLLVTIAADNPAITTQRDVPFTDAIPERFNAMVAETRAALNQLAEGAEVRHGGAPPAAAAAAVNAHSVVGAVAARGARARARHRAGLANDVRLLVQMARQQP